MIKLRYIILTWFLVLVVLTLAIIIFLNCHSEMNGRSTSVNVLIKRPWPRARARLGDVIWRPQQLWYDISSNTKMWSTVHYEHRHFPYGTPAIVVMMFHHHNVSFPPIRANIDNYRRKESLCLEPKLFHFGRLHLKVKLETKHFFLVVFKLPKKYNHADISSALVQLSNSSNCSTFITPRLQIYHHHRKKVKKIEFATCLHQGLDIQDNRRLELASWLEIQRALGTQHVTIYNQNISSNILKMLQEYRKEDFVEILDWKIHNPNRRIAVNGQLCLINDCFYRYLRRAKYVMFVDLDEVIIPHKEKTLSQMMESLTKTNKTTEYRFYSSFWHDLGEDVPGVDRYINHTDIAIPIHFKRTYRTKDCPIITRYKYIVRTEGAIHLHVHNVVKVKRGDKRLQVPESTGLSHHYRTPDYAMNETKVQDTSMSRYIDKVMSSLFQLAKVMNDTFSDSYMIDMTA